MEETISTTVCNIIDPLIIQVSTILFPSNHIPWAIIAVCIGSCALMILGLRYLLQSENSRRDGEKRDETYDDVYITQETEDGIKSEKRVDKVRIHHTTRLAIAKSRLDLP